MGKVASHKILVNCKQTRQHKAELDWIQIVSAVRSSCVQELHNQLEAVFGGIYEEPPRSIVRIVFLSSHALLHSAKTLRRQVAKGDQVVTCK